MAPGKHSLAMCFAFLIVHTNSITSLANPIGNSNMPEVEKSSSDTTAPPKSSDFVINSIDEGLLISGKRGSSERHHYEPQTESTSESSVAQAKPEPRNQQDDQQVMSSQDPSTLDQRPSQSGSVQLLAEQSFTNQPDYNPQRQQQDQLATGLAQAQLYTTTTTSSPLGQVIKQTTSTPQAYVPPVSPQSQQPASAWFQSSQPATSYQSVQQPAQSVAMQQQQVQAAASTNQPVATQHPSSINSIIASGQELPALPTNGQATGQMVTVNGQPMLLVNPNQATNGRRISISGWLKGLSNILANIFNRRGEHGAQMAGSSPSGHWLQLSPNAPHWLTQAQTAIQQQQQQFQQQAQMLASATNNRLVNLLSPSSQVTPAVSQQQPVVQVPAGYQVDPMQASSNSVSFVAVQAPSIQQQQQQSQVQVQPAPQSAPSGQFQTLPVQNTVAGQQQTNTGSRQMANEQQQARASWPMSNLPSNQQGSGASATLNQAGVAKTATRQHAASSGNLPLAHYSGNFAAIASSSLYS